MDKANISYEIQFGKQASGLDFVGQKTNKGGGCDR